MQTKIRLIKALNKLHSTVQYGAAKRCNDLPQFGERLAGNNYMYRPGAYAVVFDADQRVVVIKNKYGYYFLLDGGAECSVTMEEALQREVLEESGYDSKQCILLPKY